MTADSRLHKFMLYVMTLRSSPFHTFSTGVDSSADQSHRLERVVPTYVPAGVRSRGLVAAIFCPSGCGTATGAVVHSNSLTQ